MINPKTLGPRADKALKDMRTELQDWLHDVNEALDKMPTIGIYSELSAGLKCSYESTFEPLLEELAAVDHDMTTHEIELTERLLPR